ncbi:MAG: acetyl-CoA carboxylase biotin carboxyl carrier protein subunit [Candidatus Kapabacteria bacterium]|nr:acetyl-CoA carboxylase biotin carboxyl carrier protein subunit [Candidatus Kapabacteria bacterium]
MYLIHNGKKIKVELEKINNEYNLLIDNNKKNLSITKFSENCLLINNNGTTRKFYYAKSDKFIYINSNGFTSKLEIVDDDEESQFDYDKKSGNKDIIKPPMPGSVVKVLVEVGQLVSEGEPLIIVEAMKMETTLYSSIDGKVTELNVQTGEQVDSDKILLIVEKE